MASIPATGGSFGSTSVFVPEGLRISRRPSATKSRRASAGSLCDGGRPGSVAPASNSLCRNASPASSALEACSAIARSNHWSSVTPALRAACSAIRNARGPTLVSPNAMPVLMLPSARGPCGAPCVKSSAAGASAFRSKSKSRRIASVPSSKEWRGVTQRSRGLGLKRLPRRNLSQAFKDPSGMGKRASRSPCWRSRGAVEPALRRLQRQAQ